MMTPGEGVGAATASLLKIPESVLVVIYTPLLDVLLLERVDHAGFWQSVTGSRASPDEPLDQTCMREVREETGQVLSAAAFDDWNLTHRYVIYAHWRRRYAAGVTHNTEHVFGLCVPQPFAPVLAVAEHTGFRWLPWRDAAEACFSWTNAQAIRQLEQRARTRQRAVDQLRPGGPGSRGAA